MTGPFYLRITLRRCLRITAFPGVSTPTAAWGEVRPTARAGLLAIPFLYRSFAP